MNLPDRPLLLGLSGSLRRESYSTAVLRTLVEAMTPRAEIRIFDLAPIPLYNADDDGEVAPPPVQTLREAIDAAAGLVVVSPEYNFGMSGVLKNALDWGSRPTYKSPLTRKPVVFMTASPSFVGGARARQQLLETFEAMLSRVVVTPPVLIGSVHQKVRDGRLADETSLKFATDAVDALIAALG
jgi:chromate reductase